MLTNVVRTNTKEWRMAMFKNYKDEGHIAGIKEQHNIMIFIGNGFDLIESGYQLKCEIHEMKEKSLKI